MSPLTGVAMRTKFTLSCENWEDSESPLTYVFSYESRGSETVLFYRTVASGVSISVTDWLPVGDAQNDYNLSVIIHIKDILGAKNERVLIVKVNIENLMKTQCWRFHYWSQLKLNIYLVQE